MDLITIDDVAKLDIRVATILEAEAHPKADKLVVLKVDAGDTHCPTGVGEKEMLPRQIVAGILGGRVRHLEENGSIALDNQRTVGHRH